MKAIIYLIVLISISSCKVLTSKEIDTSIEDVVLSESYLYTYVEKKCSENCTLIVISNKLLSERQFLSSIKNINSFYYLVEDFMFFNYFDENIDNNILGCGNSQFNNYHTVISTYDTDDYILKISKIEKETKFKIRDTWTNLYNNSSNTNINLKESKVIKIITHLCEN